MSEFGETQWNLLPSSYTVCGLISRIVESVVTCPKLFPLSLTKSGEDVPHVYGHSSVCGANG